MSLPDFSPEACRPLFPHTDKGIVYLNHAGLSPLPAPAVHAIHEASLERQHGSIDHFRRNYPKIQETRERISRLIGAGSASRIAFIPNTSYGLNLVAQGLDLVKGDEILIYKKEFPSNVYPWLLLQEKGVSVRFIEDRNGCLPAEAIRNALRPETKVVAISLVQYLSGYRADMKAISRICRDNGILLIGDGIQAVGQIPVDVQESGLDALACGTHKWLMGSQGLGFLYTSDDLRQQIKLSAKGWLSVQEVWNMTDFDQPLSESSTRFEPGTLNIPAILGLRESLTILSNTGAENIKNHLHSLTSVLIDELSDSGLHLYGSVSEEARSGIVTFQLPEAANCDKLLDRLADENIHLAIRNNMLRISPHFYMTEAEMYRTASMIKQTLKSS